MNLRHAPTMIILALALGAATTLALAWLAARATPRHFTAPAGPNAVWHTTLENKSVRTARIGPFVRRVAVFEFDLLSEWEPPVTRRPGPGPHKTVPWARSKPAPHPYAVTATVGVGVPFVAYTQSRSDQMFVSDIAPGMTPPPAYTPFVFTGKPPIRPYWPGAMANTLLWAGAWGAAALLLWQIRRRLRGAHGSCTRCGYNLAGVPRGTGCPECGDRAPPARRAHNPA